MRKDGSREALLDVVPWDFNHQIMYPVDVSLEAGDTVETRCEWTNPTSFLTTAPVSPSAGARATASFGRSQSSSN